jgi:hypothetical protein
LELISVNNKLDNSFKIESPVAESLNVVSLNVMLLEYVVDDAISVKVYGSIMGFIGTASLGLTVGVFENVNVALHPNFFAHVDGVIVR